MSLPVGGCSKPCICFLHVNILLLHKCIELANQLEVQCSGVSPTLFFLLSVRFPVLTSFPLVQAAVGLSLVRPVGFWLCNAGVNVFFVTFTAPERESNQLRHLSCHGSFFCYRRRYFAWPVGRLRLLLFLAEHVVRLVRKSDRAEVHAAELLECHSRQRVHQRSEEG